MLYYHIKTGSLYRDKVWLGTGYSGAGKRYQDGRNNPFKVAIPNVGSIPPGIYAIGEPYTHPKLGVLTFALKPMSGTETFGRSEFRIHGDNASNDASHGCIILGKALRTIISNSIERQITVTVE